MTEQGNHVGILSNAQWTLANRVGASVLAGFQGQIDTVYGNTLTILGPARPT